MLRLIRTPPLKPEDNRFDQTTHVSIANDGSSRCVRTALFQGAAAIVQRDAWLEVPAGERRRVTAAELQDANNKTHLVRLDLNEAQLRDFDQPVRAEITFEIPGHFSGESDLEGSVTESKLWAKLLSFNLDYDRETPVDLWAPFESHHRYLFHLPPGLRFTDLPHNRTVRSKWGSFSLTLKVDATNPRLLEAEYLTRLEQCRVEPADFEEFRRFHGEVSRHYRLWLTLRPSYEEGDAAALEKQLALTPADMALATALVRLYLHHGKMAEARKVLQAARHFHPDDAGLWELTVKAADTVTEEEAVYREMVRRFPNDWKYRIALGAALVDRGAPVEARQVLEPAASKGEGSVRGLAHYYLARGYLAEGQAAQALQHLTVAAAADSHSVATAEATLFKGRVYEKLGQIQLAIQAYLQTLIVDPQSQEAFQALIPLEMAAGLKAAALDHLRRYTLAAGDDSAGLLRSADLYLRLQRFDDAQELASRVKEPSVQDKVQRILGLVQYHQGNSAQAIALLEKAEPDVFVQEALIRSFLAVGRLHEAELVAQRGVPPGIQAPGLQQAIGTTTTLARRRDTLLRSLPQGASNPGVFAMGAERVVCAEFVWSQGRSAVVVEDMLAPVFAYGLEIGPAYGLRGYLALERGRLSRALADAERAVALAPNEPLGYQVRGRVQLERGSLGELADLQKAVELSRRQDAFALHWLAAAQFRHRRPDDALATQREAVRLRPQDKDLVQQLEEFERCGKIGLRRP